jgi:hypothetical protein
MVKQLNDAARQVGEMYERRKDWPAFRIRDQAY